MRPFNLNRFFASFVLPSFLAIGLFILAIFVFIIPSSESYILERKKQLVSELTYSVSSPVEEHYQQDIDYNCYRDAGGQFLFAESAGVAEMSGDGYINVKISLFIVAVLIALMMGLSLPIILRKSLTGTKRKNSDEDAGDQSREKSVALMEASAEGILMMVEGKFVFASFSFCELSGYTPEEIGSMKFGELFSLRWGNLVGGSMDPEKPVSHESFLKCKDGRMKEAVVSVSMINLSETTGYIIAIRNVVSQMQFEKERELLSGELQNVLMIMYQPMKAIAREIKRIHADATVKEAIRLMTRKKSDILFVNHGNKIVGVINEHDLTERVLATGLDPENKVIEIMTSPVITLPENALLYEGLLTMKRRELSHIALTGSHKKITGVVGFREISEVHENMAGFLIREISVSDSPGQLKLIYRRLPITFKALIESGASSGIVTHVISSVTDALHRRLIELAMDELGPAPCKFALIALGSHGRSELSLATAQDNAIITVDMQESYRKGAIDYFRLLAYKYCSWLDDVGYHKNRGEIIARNPRWNMELNGWKKFFYNIIDNWDRQDPGNRGLFFDFRYIYGEQILVNQLRNHVNKASKGKVTFLQHMARSINQVKVPLKSDTQPVDLNKILITITSYVRLLAIREMLSETNTVERAQLLLENRIIEPSLYEELIQAFDFVTHLQLRSQAVSIDQIEAPGNTIKTGKLSQIEVMILKEHLVNFVAIQTRLNGEFAHIEQKS